MPKYVRATRLKLNATKSFDERSMTGYPRRMNTQKVLLCAFVVSLAGCNGDSDLVNALCDTIVRCDLGTLGSGVQSKDQCVAYYNLQLQAFKIKYTDQASACVSDLNAASCDVLTREETLAIGSCSGDIVDGAVAIGGCCTNNLDCAGDAKCTVAGEELKCAPLELAGPDMDCGADGCQEGLVQVGSIGSQIGCQCFRRSAVGEACANGSICQESAYCNSDTICTALPTTGESCMESGFCQDAYCDFSDPTNPTCAARKPDGEPCQVGQCINSCFDGTCTGSQGFFGALGETCGSGEKPCLKNLFCKIGAGATEGTCSKWLENGEPCVQRGCRVGLTCSEGTCQPLPKNGETCVSPSGLCDPLSKTYCDESNTCLPLKGVGETCDNTRSQCQAGLICLDSKCTALCM